MLHALFFGGETNDASRMTIKNYAVKLSDHAETL
jgi:hypothetical protein